MKGKKLANDEEDIDSLAETEEEEERELKPGDVGYRKALSPREQHYAKLMADTGMGGIEAARIAFGWRCEPNSKEWMKAHNLSKSRRVREEVERIKARKVAEEKAKIDLKQEFGDITKGRLREYAFRVLERLRDSSPKAAVRFNAIRILKRLRDPGKDVNLVWKWVDVASRYQTAHCPCCHEDFPLANLKNPRLDAWRERNDAPAVNHLLPDRFSRQMELIKLADKRRTPFPTQAKILAAPERHVVGTGGARAGKSYLLALFATLGVCLPGVEVWIIGETYDRSSKEVEYLKRFLRAIFYPHFDQLFHVTHDKRTGEMILTSRWGSEVRVKSAKSKGSLTGHPLELALCAEPGWMPADAYEEIRARLPERLGRIVALGTPKGLGAFVGRLMRMSGRDETGKIIRWKAEDRLIKNGCNWNVSLYSVVIPPEENPEYVKSELAAARMELTDEEYASEFEGIGVASEGHKFASVKVEHLKHFDEAFFNRCSFVLGVDQGTRYFGACLVAFDGQKVVPCWEYFNSDQETSIKTNVIRLRARVKTWITRLGGNPDMWKLTIFDKAPSVTEILSELAEEGQPWPTEITERHTNMVTLGENWRRENQEFVNNMARAGRLWFHTQEYDLDIKDEVAGSYQLHDQIMQVIDVPEDRERESKTDSNKGWQVSDPWRGDHVLDAWYLAMWTIHTQQLQMQLPKGAAELDPDDPWASQKAMFAKQIKDDEDRVLRPERWRQREPRNANEAFNQLVQRARGSSNRFRGHYDNES